MDGIQHLAYCLFMQLGIYRVGDILLLNGRNNKYLFNEQLNSIVSDEDMNKSTPRLRRCPFKIISPFSYEQSQGFFVFLYSHEEYSSTE